MSVPVPNLISWPLEGIIRDGKPHFAANDQSVRDVMLNILLTRPGERLMRPEFGAGLLDFVHQPNNETTRHLMADVARKSIEQWEPRVLLSRVEALADAADPSLVRLMIDYQLRHDPRPLQLTLSLNLEQLS